MNLYNWADVLCLREDWQSLNVTLEVQGHKQALLLSKQAECLGWSDRGSR